MSGTETQQNDVIETETPAAENGEVEALEAATTETEQADSDDGDDSDGQDRDDTGRLKGKGAEKRIAKLVRARHDAERRAESYRKEVEYLRGNASQTAQGDGQGKPARDQFETDDDYLEAMAEHAASKAVAKAQLERAQTAQTSATNAAWAARVAETKETVPDYDAVVNGSTAPVEAHIFDALMQAESGPALVYHFAKNPGVLERLNGLSPMRAGIELGKLEATLTAPVVKKPSNAPEPPTLIGGATSTSRDPAKMSTADYMAMRRQQMSAY